jgi:hypothetical protein
MNESSLDPIADPTFGARARVEGRTASLELSGIADLAAKARLDSYLRALRAEAARIAVEEVTVDFRRLGFMNSSCFKTFVDWLSDLQGQAESRRYRIRFVADPEVPWQRRSLKALHALAPEIARVEERPALES